MTFAQSPSQATATALITFRLRLILRHNSDASKELITRLATLVASPLVVGSSSNDHLLRGMLVRGSSEAPAYLELAGATSPCGMADRNTRPALVGG